MQCPAGKRLPAAYGQCLSLRPTRSLVPDLPVPPPPPLNPATRQPLTADDLAPIFPKGLIEQEVSLQAQAQPVQARRAQRRHRRRAQLV